MKKLLLILTLYILQANLLFGQPNSVELKDGSGTSLGFHPNISSAYLAISQPLTQSYLIELQTAYDASQETMPVTLTEKTGSSAVNTITIRPAATVVTMTISGNQSGSAVIMFDGADYVILDGRAGGSGSSVLTVENTGSGSGTNTIQLENGAENNLIRNIDIRNSTTGSAGRGVAILGTNTGRGNTNNRIEFCKLISGRYKINSNPGSSGFPNHGTVIYGCEFLDIMFVGVWGQSNSGKMYVDSNSFHNISAVGQGTYAILFDAQSDTVFINGNHIYDLDNGSNASEVVGISIRSTSSTNQGTSYITNNFIAHNATNTASDLITGIQYDGGNPVTAHVYFNTVRITGTGGSSGTSGSIASAGLIKEANDDSASSFDIRNNIFVNERAGGVSGAQHVALGLSDTTSIDQLDHNTYGSPTTLVRWGTTLYPDMNLYRAARFPLEQNSNDTAVDFVSATDLHLTGTSPGNDGLAGVYVAEVPDDYDGDLRNGVPYRGADEGSIILSREELSGNQGMLIYPNPASGNLKLSFYEQIQFVEIYSSVGELVKRIPANEMEITIDINSLKAGIYYIVSDVNRYGQKVVIIR